MDVILTTPERELTRGEIVEVFLPTVEGEIAVLPGHAPIVAALKAGVVELRMKDGTVEHAAITGGLVEILPDKLSILATGGELADSLEEEKIQDAKRRAVEAKANARGDEEFAVAAAALERATAQEKALERRRRWRTK